MASPSTYLTVPGGVAFSRSRSQAIAASIGAREVRSQWIHYVHTAQPLDSPQQSALDQLLRYGDITDISPSFSPEDGEFDIFYIFPRTGTISPWSSQATGISHVCGLRKYVKRVERGMKISCLRGNSEYKPGFQDFLHDRMTQIMSQDEPDLQLMFSDHVPQSLQVIRLHGTDKSPKETLQEANKMNGVSAQRVLGALLTCSNSHDCARTASLQPLSAGFAPCMPG